MPSRTPLRTIIRIAYLVVLLGMLMFVGYRGRCKVLTCQPATWSAIYEIAQTQAAKAGPSYRVGLVQAEPSFHTNLTAEGPYDITIRIKLISAQPDAQEDGLYPEQTIEFTDRDQWISWWNNRQWTGELPLLESQQRLTRVRIDPREVYRRTWALAQRELSSAIQLGAASMDLYTDESMQVRFGVESAWAISYYDDVDYLIYWIDAQTGTLIQQTKERIHKP
jgi:hypothetical protein